MYCNAEFEFDIYTCIFYFINIKLNSLEQCNFYIPRVIIIQFSTSIYQPPFSLPIDHSIHKSYQHATLIELINFTALTKTGTMEPINAVRSHKMFKKLSITKDLNHTVSQGSPEQRYSTFRTIKSLKHHFQTTQKALHQPQNRTQPSHFASQHIKNITTTHIQCLFQMSTKQIHRLFDLLSVQPKSQDHYDQIDSIFCKYHLGFFQQVRVFLTTTQYHQLIDKCKLTRLAEGKIISKKYEEDDEFYVLVDGEVSFNQEKLIKNMLKNQEEIEYIPLYTAQKGNLLNSQALISPKYNPYTVITHSPTTLISFNAHDTYSKLLKRFFVKRSDQHSTSLANTSLFKGISPLNIKRLEPYFFYKNFYKFNQNIYRQGQGAEYVYWVVEGEVELVKEEREGGEESGKTVGVSAMREGQNKKMYKIVKLSKYEIFGIDDYPFKPTPNYLFTARVSSQTLRTICISYKSLTYIQNDYPCLNENIDFYLKRSTAMHSKLLEKNHRLLQVKDNLQIDKKKRNKRNKKKKKNPSQLQWWGLAQNNLSSKRFQLQLPKFVTLQRNNSAQKLKTSKTQPMFNSTNYRSSKIEEFRRKIFQQDIDEMIELEERKKSIEENDRSPYKHDFIPKINKLKFRMLEIKPKPIEQTQKVKKKLLSYAKNMGTFCDKLNLD